jgi:hypothetical protein
MHLKIFSLTLPVLEKNTATLKRIACTFSVVICLALFPSVAFGEFQENPIIHSAARALAAVKTLHTRCKVGLTYSEYAWALNDVQYKIDKLDEYFKRYAEKALTEGSTSPHFEVSTCNLLGNLHLVLSFHEILKGWWERQIGKNGDPICLDLMFSGEWEELTLLLEDASGYLELMKQSLP